MRERSTSDPATRAIAALAFLALAFCAEGAWYWPFGGPKEKEPPRLSELMADASTAIDNASDLAAEGKVEEAVKEYRRALEELDKVERENPERAATPEFASVRNKRAYVNAAIDSMHVAQARENAKAVAVTDTSELEKRFAAKRAAAAEKASKKKGGVSPAPGQDAKDAVRRPKLEKQIDAYMADERTRKKDIERKAARAKTERTIRELLEKDPNSRKARVMMAGEDLRSGDTTAAKEKLRAVLAERPSYAPALNMMAVCEASEGDLKSAEKTLDQAIRTNPRDYRAYYNMANVKLQSPDGASSAKRYYETGRSVGGPQDEALEKALE